MHEDILAGGALDEPYPFAPLNHFTVPFSLTKYSFRLSPMNYSCGRFFVCPVPCALTFTAHATAQPLETDARIVVLSPLRWRGIAPTETAPNTFHRRLPVTKFRGEPRKRRRISDCRHRNVQSCYSFRQPSPVSEAPDNSREDASWQERSWKNCLGTRK